MSSEAAVRAYTVINNGTETFTESSDDIPALDTGRIIVVDTETTIDRFQNLMVGHFKLYVHLKLERHGMFYDPAMITPKERTVLAEYCKKREMDLYDVRDFVDNTLLPEIYSLQTLCVGFNLPFDLSRLAIDFGRTRRTKIDGRMVGMSGGFSLKMSENKTFPRLRIKHIEGNRAFINFGSPPDKYKQELKLKGNFVDCYVLVYALTGEKHSLKSSGKLYDTKVKKADFEWTGHITEQSLDYLVQDVVSTFSLFGQLRDQYDLFGLDLPLSKVYSAASIGKALLKMMGVEPGAAKIATIPDDIKGYCATTYIGGRTEDKIRKQEELVTVIDFTSMYPTMCILMALWDFIICDHIEVEDFTEGAKKLLDEITLNDLQNPATWSRMNAIVELQPDGDILPSRGHYGDHLSWNIALNHVTSDRKMWWALPDVVDSKLVSGKVPKIARANRFKAVGKQKGLRKVTILGKEIDPYKDNLFKWLIEYRLELQHKIKECNNPAERQLLDKKQKGIKIIANATSYGIYMQIDTEDEECDLTVHGLSTFECHAAKKEKLGEFYNPVIATLITSGARLVLGAVEKILADNGSVHTYCDTDSMTVPPQFKEKIQQFFQPLNPYDDDSVRMFKVDEYTDENGEKHLLENVCFLGLSSKRYVIYRREGDDITILKASSHGLKHLMNPFSDDASGDDYDLDVDDSKKGSWHKEVWLDIVNYNLGRVTVEQLNEKYGRSKAMAKLAITTPHLMRRLDKINKGKSYSRKIKPFNFCIVGVGSFVDPQTQKVVKPLSPFRSDPQRCAYEHFIDYESGKTLRGSHYWKKFSGIFWDYVNHPEAKFDGDIGVLSRKHVRVSSVVHIGKESNNLDVSQIVGMHDDDQITYASEEAFWRDCKDRILATPPHKVRRFNRRTWLRIQKSLKIGRIPKLKGKTAARLSAALRNSEI